MGCLLMGLLQQCKAPGNIDTTVLEQQPSLDESETILPTNPRMLRRAMFQTGKLLWVYGTGDAKSARSYEELGKQLANSYGDRIEVEVLPDTGFIDAHMGKGAVELMGTPANNSVLKRMLKNLPFGIQRDSLFFSDKSYKLARKVWVLQTYPNPLNPLLPLKVVTGSSDQEVLRYLQQIQLTRNNRFYRNPWDYELWEGSERKMMGYFSHERENAWSYDPDAHWDYLSRPPTTHKAQLFTYTLHGNIPQKELQRFSEAVQVALSDLEVRLGIRPEPLDIPLHLFESAEAKGLKIGNTNLAHIEFEENRICAVAHEAFPYVDVSPVNRMIFRKVWGEPRTLALEEGLANLYSAPWNQGGAKSWGKRLFMADALPDLTQFFSERRGDSRLIKACMGALFMDFLQEQVWGRGDFPKNYLSWIPDTY